ncbi:MAG: DinB family protein [Candidatus Thorarchaeota archaeon]
MRDFELIKANYLKLRNSVLKYLSNFTDESYYYQPTEKSNSTAWIVPHIVAFEKVMVVDKIQGYVFTKFISEEDVDMYKPGVDGFLFDKESLMSMKDALDLLEKSREVMINFLDEMINQADKISEVDSDQVFDRFMLNFSHETEHLGQLKYLLGTWKRLQK